MTPLKQLGEQGQSVWIDFLSRRFVHDGDLAGLVGDGVVGVTSNPTIFQGAIAEGDAYDDQIRELSAELAVDLVRAFVGARFDGGERYAERLRKVEAMEKEMKDGQVTTARAL